MVRSTDRYRSIDRHHVPARTRKGPTMAYEIEGKLLEVCTCNVLCPCWIGEDPDGGTCDSALAWHIDGGSIEGVDVDGPDGRPVGPHPRQRPDAEVLEGRRLRRRRRHRRAAGAAPQGLHRPARRRDRRSGRPHRRGRLGRARADHLHGRRRHAAGSTIGTIADAEMTPYIGRHRQSDDPVRDRVLDDPGLARVRRASPTTSRAMADPTACRA